MLDSICRIHDDARDNLPPGIHLINDQRIPNNALMQCIAKTDEIE